MELCQSGVENEKFLLVKLDSQAHSLQSGLVLQSGLRNIRENLRDKTLQLGIFVMFVCRDCHRELQITTHRLHEWMHRRT